MIVLNAHQLQRLAEAMLRLERLLEAEGGDPAVVREGLEEEAHRMGVHLEVVRLADPETLLQMHGPEGGGDPGKLWAIAELLYLDGLRARAEGHDVESDQRFETALNLFSRTDPGLEIPEGYPTPEERMDEAGRLLGRAL